MTNEEKQLLTERGFVFDEKSNKYICKKDKFSSVIVSVEEVNGMFIILGEIKINRKTYTASTVEINLTINALFDFCHKWNSYYLRQIYDKAFKKHKVYI